MMQQVPGDFIEFETKDHLKLNGFLYRGKANNKKLIIHLHGMGCTFLKWPLDFVLTQAARRTEFDFFAINTRGNSTITPIFKNDKTVLAGTALEHFEDCLYDIDAAIIVGENLGYSTFVLVGHSTGCQKITYYLARKHNRKVCALVLLAAVDDYNLTKKKFGSKFGDVVKVAKRMVSAGNKDLLPNLKEHLTAARFLSFADPLNVEAQLFNYETNLALFGMIKCPILALFGSEEKNAVKSPQEMLNILRKNTNSKNFKSVIIKGANHAFKNHERETANEVFTFITQLKC